MGIGLGRALRQGLLALAIGALGALAGAGGATAATQTIGKPDLTGTATTTTGFDNALLLTENAANQAPVDGQITKLRVRGHDQAGTEFDTDLDLELAIVELTDTGGSPATDELTLVSAHPAGHLGPADEVFEFTIEPPAPIEAGQYIGLRFDLPEKPALGRTTIDTDPGPLRFTEMKNVGETNTASLFADKELLIQADLQTEGGGEEGGGEEMPIGVTPPTPTPTPDPCGTADVEVEVEVPPRRGRFKDAETAMMTVTNHGPGVACGTVFELDSDLTSGGAEGRFQVLSRPAGCIAESRTPFSSKLDSVAQVCRLGNLAVGEARELAFYGNGEPDPLDKRDEVLVSFYWLAIHASPDPVDNHQGYFYDVVGPNSDTCGANPPVDSVVDDLMGIAVLARPGGGKGLSCATGGDRRERLAGDCLGDWLDGAGGADQVDGGGGSDRLEGGESGDTIDGDGDLDTPCFTLKVRGKKPKPGADALYGGDGPDRMYGGGGGDRLLGAAGPDRAYGGDGPDTVYGGPGGDLIHGDGAAHSPQAAKLGRLKRRAARRGKGGGASTSKARGKKGKKKKGRRAGNDLLVGGAGKDRIFGGGGNDRIDAADGKGGDRVDCGPGRDLVLRDKGDRVKRSGPGRCEKVRLAKG